MLSDKLTVGQPPIENLTSERKMPYVKLTTQSELPAEGEAKEFELGDRTICVANVCLHMGGPLGQGYIEGNKRVCPWHGWEYDPKTGQLEDDPKTKLPVYPIKIENGDVMVDTEPA